MCPKCFANQNTRKRTRKDQTPVDYATSQQLSMISRCLVSLNLYDFTATILFAFGSIYRPGPIRKEQCKIYFTTWPLEKRFLRKNLSTRYKTCQKNQSSYHPLLKNILAWYSKVKEQVLLQTNITNDILSILVDLKEIEQTTIYNQ